MHLRTEEERWTCDPPAEQDMHTLGVTKWRLENIDISKINVPDSWKNHARLRCPRNEDVIEAYRAAMTRGDRFPRVVLFELPNGRYLLAGGNHRTAGAAKAGLKTVGAYVVKSDDEFVLDQLPRLLNLKHGLPVPNDEKYAQAVDCVMRYGRSCNDTAKMYGLGEKTLEGKVAIRRLDQRLSVLGLRPEILSETIRKSLSTLKNDNELRAAYVFARDHKVPGDDFRDVLGRLKSERTEAKRLAFLEEESNRRRSCPAAAAPERQRQSQSQQFKAWLSRGEGMFERFSTVEKNQVTKHDDQVETCRRLRALAKTLVRMAGDCEKRLAGGTRGRAAS